MKKIFIGGFGGCGSRVVQHVLKNHYFIGDAPDVNIYYDFGHNKFVHAFDELFFNNNETPLKKLLFKHLQHKDSFSIKHGHLMFIIETLKEWFPDSSFLFIVRNPVDNMMNEYNTHHKYGKLPLDSPIHKKVDYALTEIEKAFSLSDHAVRLEDLCFNKKETLEKLFEFAEIEDNWENYNDFIITPKTIGRGKDIYNSITNPLYEKLGFVG